MHMSSMDLAEPEDDRIGGREWSSMIRIDGI